MHCSYKKWILESFEVLHSSTKAGGRVAPATLQSINDYLSTANEIVLQGLLSLLTVPPTQLWDIEMQEPLSIELHSQMYQQESDLIQKLATVHWEIDVPATWTTIVGDGSMEHVRFTTHFIVSLLRNY